jgi:hypothetical protein
VNEYEHCDECETSGRTDPRIATSRRRSRPRDTSPNEEPCGTR